MNIKQVCRQNRPFELLERLVMAAKAWRFGMSYDGM